MTSLSSLWKRTVIVVAIAIAACGALVAIFLPTLELRATENASLNNGKTLGLCCKEYAIDHHGNFPPSLDVLVPRYLPARIYLASPLMPGEPAGYSYVPGLKDTSPSTDVLIEDKFAPLKHVQIVIYADDSGKVIDVP